MCDENHQTQDEVLPCSLDDFFEKFVANDAPFPYRTYMESSGDTVLEVTNWQKDENDIYSRIIEYNHPVNAPLAPPEARARKEQRYRFYGKSGLSIETDTYVEDVPMADCFYVTDRLLVEPNDDGAVIILAEFDIRFVKRTMFRSMISNTTRSEFLKWFQGLQVYWTEALVPPIETEEVGVGEQAARIETVLVEAHPGKETVVVTSSPLAGNRLLLLLLAMVLVMQSWIILEMMGMKKALGAMEARIIEGETCRSALLDSEC